MCDKNLLLVNTVEKYPCLYNYNLSDYMRKEVTERAWNEVAEIMTLSVSECKEKWRNLRYSLLRSLKPNADGSSKKKYYLHNDMEFIIPFMKSKGPIALQDEYELDEDLNISNLEIVQSPQQQMFELDYTPEPPTKKKRVDAQLQKFVNSTEGPDMSRKWFLLGLLPEINSLTEEQMKVFRRKVLALIDEISEPSIQFEEDNSITEDINFVTVTGKRIKPEPNENHT